MSDVDKLFDMICSKNNVLEKVLHHFHTFHFYSVLYSFDIHNLFSMTVYVAAPEFCHLLFFKLVA